MTALWSTWVEYQASALDGSEVLDVFTPVREDYRELVKQGF